MNATKCASFFFPNCSYSVVIMAVLIGYINRIDALGRSGGRCTFIVLLPSLWLHTEISLFLALFFFCLKLVINFNFSRLYVHSMEGGELFQRIQDRPDGKPFTERGIKCLN